MTENGEEDRRNVPYHYYLVGVFDILGQGDDLAKMKYLPNSPEEWPQFNELNRRTRQKVLEFRRNLLEMFRIVFNKHESQDSMQHLVSPPMEKLRKTPLGIQQFSDTTITFFRLDNQEINGQAIFMTLFGSAAVMRWALSQRISFRAGIAIGPASLITDHEIYGAALACAASLEKKQGCPGIAVGDGLIEFVDSPLFGESTELRASVKSFIKLAGGLQRLDYLGEPMRQLVRSMNPGEEMRHLNQEVESGRKFVEEELRRIKHAPDILDEEKRAELLRRYADVKEYYENNMDRWT